MRITTALLTCLAGGACAATAAAQGVGPALKPWKVDTIYVHGLINGDASGFGARGDVMSCYSNVDTGPNSWIFYGQGLVHTAGEQLFLEKGGYTSFGVHIGPVAAPAKVRTLEFWVVADDGTTGSHGVPCTITFEMFETTVDWLPSDGCPDPLCWCIPSGDDSVNQFTLGGFYLPLADDLAPRNHAANQYIVDVTAIGLGEWRVTDGNCFIDNRCWDSNGTNPPTTLSSSVYNCFNGVADRCAVGSYPALGLSADNFYFDADLDGRYTRNELHDFGGFPYVANLMLRLEEDDGCSMDLNGDGFVNGDDIAYAEYVFFGGCPY